jgi:hypothetical protein
MSEPRTAHEALRMVAAELGMRVAGDVAEEDLPREIGRPRLTLDVTRSRTEANRWRIRAEINVPAGNLDAVSAAAFMGEMERLTRLQTLAQAMVAGRSWEDL